MTGCTLCPRECGADRESGIGVCGCSSEMLISRIMLHKWEEPCISGRNGSGAVFFCGCPLGCVFCQNGGISRGNGDGSFAGQRSFSVSQLADEILNLQGCGAHNINFVSPTQYTGEIKESVRIARERGLTVPVVWNTGGYEKPETVSSLKDTVQIYLTDLKYYSPEVSETLSGAPDYFDAAFSSLLEMVEQAGEAQYDENGMMTRGVIVRHLVLPGLRRESELILRKMADAGLASLVVLSLMSQYTPDFFRGCGDERLDRSLRRRVTTFEYRFVEELASELGFTGFGQERSSAVKEYTPEWGNFTVVEN